MKTSKFSMKRYSDMIKNLTYMPENLSILSILIYYTYIYIYVKY